MLELIGYFLGDFLLVWTIVKLIYRNKFKQLNENEVKQLNNKIIIISIIIAFLFAILLFFIQMAANIKYNNF